MDEHEPSGRAPDTLGGHFLRGLRNWRPRRPVSLFLLVAMLVMLVLGVQFVYVRDDPKRFAFFLSLYFIFFFVVIARALVDFIEVMREHVRERERLFRETFVKDGFAQELGAHVTQHDRNSWPEF